MQTNKLFSTVFTSLLLATSLLTGCDAPAPEPLAEMTPIEATIVALTAPATTVTPATVAPATEAPPTIVPTVTLAATPAPTTPTPTAPVMGAGDEPAPQPDTGMAVVENVDVRILESFPVQVQAVVTGYLPDGCTTIATAEAVQEGSEFRIVITTERPEDAICTMAIVPFAEVVPLVTADLPAGAYQVVVNDLSVSFTLPEGNAASEGDSTSADTSAPAAGAFPVVESATEFVQAQVDVPMFDAPAVDANEIGMVAGGQMARVTGASADGAWWRVICPDDSVGDCWVSAAPEMTQPTTPPQ